MTTESDDRVTTKETTSVVSRVDRAEFRRLLLSLSPEEFEYFVADLWDRLRPGTPEVTELSGDMGVDVAVTDGLEREMIQVKRYHKDNPVGRPDVQQYYSLYDQEGADRVTVVTSGEFTDQAMSWAATHGVTLYDGDDLYDLVQDAGLSDLLSKWFIDADYKLRDAHPLWRKLKRVLGPVVRVPGLVFRLGRPVWAGVMAAFSGLLVLAGVIALFVQTVPIGEGSGSGSPPVSGTAAAALGATVLISAVSFPISLALHGARRRALLFVGALLAIPAVPALLTGEIARILGFGAVYAILSVLAAEDLYRVYRVGIGTHLRTTVERYREQAGLAADDSGDKSGTTNVVNPINYATVAERRE